MESLAHTKPGRQLREVFQHMFNLTLGLCKSPMPHPRAKDLNPKNLNSYRLLRTHLMRAL